MSWNMLEPWKSYRESIRKGDKKSVTQPEIQKMIPLRYLTPQKNSISVRQKKRSGRDAGGRGLGLLDPAPGGKHMDQWAVSPLGMRDWDVVMKNISWPHENPQSLRIQQ